MAEMSPTICGRGANLSMEELRTGSQTNITNIIS